MKFVPSHMIGLKLMNLYHVGLILEIRLKLMNLYHVGLILEISFVLLKKTF